MVFHKSWDSTSFVDLAEVNQAEVNPSSFVELAEVNQADREVSPISFVGFHVADFEELLTGFVIVAAVE